MAEPTKKQTLEEQPLSDILIGFVLVSAIFSVVISLSLLMLVGTFKYPTTVGLFFTAPYLTYTLFVSRDELKDGNHWPEFSKNSWALNTIRNYLRLEVQKPVPKELTELDNKPNAQVFLAVFPHGCYSDYRVAMDGILHEAIPNMADKVRTLAATAMFRLPVVREIGLWTGCVDASRKVAERQFEKGGSVLVLPGGEAEQIRTENGKEIVYVEKRKGFIKLALRKNVPVVPGYVFGASDMYHTSNALFGLRQWLVKNMGVAVVLSMGKWGWPLCPINVKTTIVFGKPIEMKPKKEGEPTDEEVQAKHKEFVEALQKLFDENKEALGYGDRKLQII